MLGPITSLSAYLVIWWVVFLAIAGIGTQSHHEAGIEVPGGGDPGSPVNPNLKKKFITATWVAAVVLAVVWVTVWIGDANHWWQTPGTAQVY